VLPPLVPAAGADLDDRQRALLAWGERNRRDLPWRRTRDPWAVLVSELMLQQTQVARVVGRYDAFLDRFPTAAACATAGVGDVVRAWAGLGYNRRAVNLHRAAVIMVERHDGRLPADLAQLLALPGVGPYTARAVLAFAFERDHGVLDTNSARVLARWHGRPLQRAEAQTAADAAVPAGRAWAWNQAMLDLGATRCRRQPQCDACPIRPWCAWAAASHEPPDPAEGSAGVSRAQSPFVGSFREGRGRLVARLRTGSLSRAAIAAAAGWPDDEARAEAAAASLVREGLAVDDGDHLHLA
jgi:A/G-specific adenine glycosylase